MAESDEKEAFKQEFIERVRDARGSTGKKQWEIALALGIEQDEYKHWEVRGRKGRLMPHHLIARFSFVTHVDPIWLLTGHGKMKGTPLPALAASQERPAAAVQPKRARARRSA